MRQKNPSIDMLCHCEATFQVTPKQAVVSRLLRSLKSLAMTERRQKNSGLLILILAGVIFNARILSAEEAAPKQKERDPMLPVQISLFADETPKAHVKRTSVRLQGVGHSEKGAYAIIEGKLIREGETKKGVTVVKVGDTKVDILIDGIEESIPIKQ